MARAGYITYVRFFKDDPTWSKVHVYIVPPDRKTLPVASIFVNAAWDNDNGPHSSLFQGYPPFEQGDQWANRNFDRRLPHRPGEAFTGRYCGTPEQWKGEMRYANPADRGLYGCCRAINSIAYGCGCERAEAVVTLEYGFRFQAHGGEVASFTARAEARYQVRGCECGSSRIAPSTAARFAARGCTCTTSTTAVTTAGLYSGACCQCERGLTGSRWRLPFWACACSTAEATFSTSARYSLRAISGERGAESDAATGQFALLASEGEQGYAAHRAAAFHEAVAVEGETAEAAELAEGAYQAEVVCGEDAAMFGREGRLYAVFGDGGEAGEEANTAAALYDVLGIPGEDAVFTGSSFVPLVAFNCANLTATGATQGTAAAIGDDNVSVTGASSGLGVILPSGCYRILVWNDNTVVSGRQVAVYPPVGGFIGGAAQNTPVNVAPKAATFFVTYDGGSHWRTITVS